MSKEPLTIFILFFSQYYFIVSQRFSKQHTVEHEENKLIKSEDFERKIVSDSEIRHNFGRL